MSKWSEIYKREMSKFVSLDEFISSKVEYKKCLIEIIKKYSKKNGKILEVGCGSGITSIFLEKNCYNVTGIDLDKDMIELARTIALQQKSSALFKIENIKTLGTIQDHFDTIFSNGVMEHFSDSEIISIVNRHLSVSNYVIVSIPSDYFSTDQRIYGDERFMSSSSWRSILLKTKGIIIEEFDFNSNKNITDKPQFIGFVLSSV